MDKGGVIVWCIVPTGFEAFAQEDVPSMVARLERVWALLAKKGIDKQALFAQSLLPPATCCLINPDKEKTVERAFQAVRDISHLLRRRYRLST